MDATLAGRPGQRGTARRGRVEDGGVQQRGDREEDGLRRAHGGAPTQADPRPARTGDGTMSDSAFPSLSALPPDEARLVDKLCTRFEDALKMCERPRVEDYRPEVPEAVWPVLERELLALKVAYRVREGEQPVTPRPSHEAADSSATPLDPEGPPARSSHDEGRTPVYQPGVPPPAADFL